MRSTIQDAVRFLEKRGSKIIDSESKPDTAGRFHTSYKIRDKEGNISSVPAKELQALIIQSKTSTSLGQPTPKSNSDSIRAAQSSGSGHGRGNWGHAGRPGQLGGSA
jgi:hypothetical protein